jgi:hypothetical protein
MIFFLAERLDKCDIYLISLGIYIIYHKKVLQPISYQEYCEKFSHWSNPLDPNTTEPIGKRTDFYDQFSFDPKESCHLLHWELTTHSLEKIASGVEFLQKVELGYSYKEDLERDDKIRFYVLPTLRISKRKGVLTEINTTISTLLFGNVLNNELVLTKEIFMGFLQFMNTKTSMKKPYENVYQTFIETLTVLSNNENTIDIKKYLSLPKEKNVKPRDRFFR